MRLKLQQIRELIGSSKLDEAIRQLKEYISSEEKYQGFFNTILLLQSEYRRFQIDEIEGVADEKTFARLSQRVLKLINQVNTTDEIVYITDKNSSEKSLVFKKTEDELYNEDFYLHLNSTISNARSEILITGEGFEYADTQGERIAADYCQALEMALKRGVNVIRIQTKVDISEQWKVRLRYFLEEYPENFKLYFINDQDTVDISSICVFDTNEPEEYNVIEYMVSFQQIINNRNVSLAGLAFFINKQHDLNERLRTRFYDIVNGRTIEVDANTIDAYVGKRLYYFGYGANMDLETIRNRCPSAERIGIGYKDNFQLVFNRKGSYRPGGVSSIEPQYNGKVFGIIYSILEKDLLALDEVEDPEAYTREELKISAYSKPGQVYLCNVYLSFRVKDIEPDPDYLNLIIQAAQKENLPQWYVNRLIKMKK